jgi:signal transduction histidine kinase
LILAGAHPSWLEVNPALLKIGILISLMLWPAGRLCAQSWLNPELARIRRLQDNARQELELLPEDCVVQTPVHAGFHGGFAPSADAARWVQVDLGVDYPIDGVVVVPATLGNEMPYGFPQRFRIEVGRDSLMSEPETLFESSEAGERPSVYPRYADGRKVVARYVRFTALSLVPEPRQKARFIFCLGELMVFSGGRNVALGAVVLAPTSAESNPAWAVQHLVDGCHAMGIPSVPAANISNGWHSGIFKSPEQTSWVQLEFSEPESIREIRLVPAHPADYPDRAGFGFPIRFKVETSLARDFSNPTSVYESSGRDFTNPEDTPVGFAFPELKARVVRVTASRLWERNRDYVFALAEMQVFSGEGNCAAKANVSFSDQTVTGRWGAEFLIDGKGGRGVLVDEYQWLVALAKKRVIRSKLESLSDLKQTAETALQKRLLLCLVALVVLGIAGALGFVLHARRVRRKEIAGIRDQISKDLHDEIGSSLCSIRLISEMVGSDQKKGYSDSESMAEIRALAAESTEALRDIVWLVKAGDFPSCVMLLEQMRRSAASLLIGMEWGFTVEGTFSDERAPLDLHRDVLLFFREALHNVARHSRAALVKITLARTTLGFYLSVSDNGQGFDTEAPVAGRGMHNMRERAARLSAVLSVQSRVGEGTLIALEVPLK